MDRRLTLVLIYRGLFFIPYQYLFNFALGRRWLSLGMTKKKVTKMISKLILEIDNYSGKDGFAIGLIYANAKDIITLLTTEHQLPPMTDNRIQQLALGIKFLKEQNLIK